MNKTTKRILALILTLCTVFGLLVPAVFAEEGSTTNTFFDFTTTGGEKGNKWEIIRNATNKEIGSDNFALSANGIHVKFGIAWDTCDPSLTIDGTTVKGQFGRWFAIELNNIPAGTYEATFAMSSVKNGGYANLYVIDGEEYKRQEASYFPDGDAGITLEKTDELFSKLNFIKEAKYDSCYYTYSGYSAKQKIGEVTFEKTGNYVLIIQCYGRSTGDHPQFSTKSLTLTPVVSVDDTPYADFSTALKNADSGDEIKLLADRTEETVQVPAGVTLNLNGYTLTAAKVQSAGTVKDSTNGKGLLAINQNTDNDTYLTLQTNNEQLPLYDKTNSGYRFYTATLTGLTPDTAVGATQKYWFRLAFSNDAAYDLIMTGSSGLEIGANLSWTVNGVADSAYAHPAANSNFYSADGWAGAVKTNPKVAIGVTIKGIDQVSQFQFVPTVTSTGVTLQ